MLAILYGWFKILWPSRARLRAHERKQLATQIRQECRVEYELIIRDLQMKLDESRVQFEKAQREIRWLTVFVEDIKLQLQKVRQIEPLTGCLNGQYFMDQVLPVHFRKAASDRRDFERQPQWLCLWYIDARLFKAINDKLGHAVGDKVLVIYGRLLQEHLGFPKSSYYPARKGGDEFMALLPQVEDMDGVVELVRNFQASFAGVDWAQEDPKFLDHPNLRPSLDVGVLFIPMSSLVHGGIDHAREVAVDLVDQLMYKAKQGGSGLCVMCAAWSSVTGSYSPCS